MSEQYHLLDERGLVLIITDIPPTGILPRDIRKEFAGVITFCSAMMRAISNTINPHTGGPYSIYNYHAIESILVGSKQFQKKTEDTIQFRTDKTLHDFGKHLYNHLFQVTLGDKETHTISSILATLGLEAKRMIDARNPEEFKVGYITIIVEYTNGISNVSLNSVYADCYENEESVRWGPCKRRKRRITSWKFHTGTYLYQPEHLSKTSFL